MSHNEVHLCDYPNGHELSTDCWCEPVNIRTMVNKHGIEMLVVEHVDDTPIHHIVIVNNRELEPDWITRVLAKVKRPKGF